MRSPTGSEPISLGSTEPSTAEARHAQTHERPELREVFEAHHAYVWTTLRRMGVRAADLDDVTHDVFLVVRRKLPDFELGRPMKPWLFGIAVRVASDHRRLARHRREVSSDRTDEHPDDGGGVEEALESKQRRALLLRALESLEPDRRAVLVLHDLDETPMPEVAHALGIPTNTGYSRLRAARHDLGAAVRRLRGEVSRG